mmetsp:Transcript_7953/g.11503  ORF Transcript_7953/g.11503 Transcript_7953/m.11503 type:complete len:459 (-) Transcript_7953:53-1429(-)
MTEERRECETPSRRSKCGCLKYLNFSIITVLSVLVGFMFFQLQYLSYRISSLGYQLDREEMRLEKLENVSYEVQDGQQQEIANLNEKVEKNESLTLIQMAGTFVLLTCLLTMFHMASHLRNFHEPVVQRKVIAILWMSPIYALTSFLSIVVSGIEGYMAIIKDFYEAYVIYTFLSYLIAVLGKGDRSRAVLALAKQADHLTEPRKCFRRCYHPLPEESPEAKANAILVECQILAMQFVLCRPITSIASFVVTALLEDEYGSYDDDNSTAEAQKYFTSPQFWISMVQNISVFLAFSGLIKFYHAVSNDLAWISPFSKFLCIKGIVFMTFWQGLVINIIVSLEAGGRWEEGNSDTDPREKAMRLQNILICLEMLFFSIAHWCVFPPEEYEEGYRRRNLPKPGIGFSDFVADVGLIVESSKQAKRSRQMRDGNYLRAGEIRPDSISDEPLEMQTELDVSIS